MLWLCPIVQPCESYSSTHRVCVVHLLVKHELQEVILILFRIRLICKHYWGDKVLNKTKYSASPYHVSIAVPLTYKSTGK